MSSDNGQRAHTISLYVNNKPGVLNRITLTFSRRGWNIDSLAVSEAHDGQYSHCTIVAKGEPDRLEKIVSQLNKLVDVIHAQEHRPDEVVSRELALAKIGCNGITREDIVAHARPLGWEPVDESESTVTLELRGTTLEIDEAHRSLSGRFTVLEVVRTGAIAIARGRAET